MPDNSTNVILPNIDLLRLLLSRLSENCNSIQVAELVEGILSYARNLVYNIYDDDGATNELRKAIMKCKPQSMDIEDMVYMCDDIAKRYLTYLTTSGILNDIIYVVEITDTNVVINTDKKMEHLSVR